MTVDEQMETLRKAQQHYERDIREETAMGENCYTPVEKKDEYASKATAGTALGFGIGSTVLTLLQQNGGLGGLLGGCGCGRQQYITREEAALQNQLSAKDSEIALLKANTYGDQKMLEMYKYIDGKLGEVQGVLASQAVNNQATKDSFQLLQERMECCKNELCGAINRERDERKCADNTIVTYTNATFYPKMVADITTGTGTTPQSTYNPLPVSTCGCGC